MTPSSAPPGCLSRANDVLVHGANGVCGVPEGLAKVAGHPALPGGTTALAALAVVVAFGALWAPTWRLPSKPLRPGGWLRALGGEGFPRGPALVVAALLVSSGAGYTAVLHGRADAPARMAALAAEESTEVRAMERLAARSVGCMRPPSACTGCEALLHYAAPTGQLCGRRLAHLGAAAAAPPCPRGATCAEAHVSDAPRVP